MYVLYSMFAGLLLKTLGGKFTAPIRITLISDDDQQSSYTVRVRGGFGCDDDGYRKGPALFLPRSAPNPAFPLAAGGRATHFPINLITPASGAEATARGGRAAGTDT